MENIIDPLAYLGFIIVYKVGNLKYKTLLHVQFLGKENQTNYTPI